MLYETDYCTFLFLSLDTVSLITYSFYAAASVDKQLLFWQPAYSVEYCMITLYFCFGK